MSNPFVGEIRMFGGNFAPAGWAFCDGQVLPISENETLFQLIGTTYGGDGESTFALPDLQSRTPRHIGPASVLGATDGTESVTLTTQQIPVHNHPFLAAGATASDVSPQNALGAEPASKRIYRAPAVPGAMAGFAAPAGGSQPHENMQPFLCINFIISLFGIFPSPT
jgi:microcystin-dependent protein